MWCKCMCSVYELCRDGVCPVRVCYMSGVYLFGICVPCVQCLCVVSAVCVLCVVCMCSLCCLGDGSGSGSAVSVVSVGCASVCGVCRCESGMGVAIVWLLIIALTTVP